jgi:hypothetical protein
MQNRQYKNLELKDEKLSPIGENWTVSKIKDFEGMHGSL